MREMQASGELDMRVAFPGGTLSALGIGGVPEGMGVVLPVTGTVMQPRVHYAQATKSLAMQMLQGRAERLQDSGLGLPRWMTGSATSGGGAAAWQRLPQLPA